MTAYVLPSVTALNFGPCRSCASWLRLNEAVGECQNPAAWRWCGCWPRHPWPLTEGHMGCDQWQGHLRALPPTSPH